MLRSDREKHNLETSRRLDAEINKTVDDISKLLKSQYKLTLLDKYGNIQNEHEEEAFIPFSFTKEMTDRDSVVLRTLNGKMRLYIGTYGNRKEFRTRKDGTFNIDAIAEYLSDQYRWKLRSEKKTIRKRQQNEKYREMRDYLNEEYGFGAYSGPLDANSEGLMVKLTGLSEEQVRQVIDFAKENGIL